MKKIKTILYDYFFSLYFYLPVFLKNFIAKMVYRPKIDSTVKLFGYVGFSKGVKIGAYTYICENSFLSNVTIGKYCCIAKKVSIVDGTHPFCSFSNYSLFHQVGSPLRYMPLKITNNHLTTTKHTTIGNDVWIGEDVSIKGGVTIGDGAVIGTKSMVTKDIPPYAIAVGNPAKVIKYRFEENKIKLLQKIEWWNWEPEKIYDNLELLDSFDKKLFDL